MAYDFLILDLIFAIPVVVILVCRRDLAPVMKLNALAALPFAFTETWFYPAYWEPTFLFDLGARWGFGIEDFLFVSIYAAFASTTYAAVTGMQYKQDRTIDATSYHIAVRAAGLVIAALGMAGMLAVLSIPMVYGAAGVMLILTGGLLIARADLAWPALWGGVLSFAGYLLLCVIFARILPDVFDITWHADRLSGITLLGVPFEEPLYGLACGSLATVFYPYVTGARFIPAESPRASSC